MKPSHSGLPIWVGKSAVLKMSFTPTGMPSSERSGSPVDRCCVVRAAASSSRSSSKLTQAFKVGSLRCCSSMQWRATSTGVNSPLLKPSSGRPTLY